MAEYLLTSEKFVKETTNISDNVAGKYILPSIREAQEIKLKSILGSCLLSTLKTMGSTKTTDAEGNEIRTLDAEGNEAYKELVDQCQYFLAYSALVELLPRVSYKVGNFGVSKSTDENLQVATQDEIAKQEFFYQSKADYYALELQQWLLDNKASFPELSECQCGKIRSNLYSAATCGLWLGGPRGRVSVRNNCKCVKK